MFSGPVGKFRLGRLSLAKLWNEMKKRSYTIAFPKANSPQNCCPKSDDAEQPGCNDHACERMCASRDHTTMPGDDVSTSETSEEKKIELPLKTVKLIFEILHRERQLQDLNEQRTASHKALINCEMLVVEILSRLPDMLSVVETRRLGESWREEVIGRQVRLQEAADQIDIRLELQRQTVIQLTAELKYLVNDVTSCLDQHSSPTQGLPVIQEGLFDLQIPIDLETLEQWKGDITDMDEALQILEARKAFTQDFDGRTSNGEDQHRQNSQQFELQLRHLKMERTICEAKLAESCNEAEILRLGKDIREIREDIEHLAGELTLRGRPHTSSGSVIYQDMAGSFDLGPGLQVVWNEDSDDGLQNPVMAEPEPEKEEERYLTREEVAQMHQKTRNWIESVDQVPAETVNGAPSLCSPRQDEFFALPDIEVGQSLDSNPGPELSTDFVERHRIDAWTARREKAFDSLPDDAKISLVRNRSAQDVVNNSPRQKVNSTCRSL